MSCKTHLTCSIAVWLLHTALSFSTYTLRLMLPVYCVMAVKACIPQASTFIMCVKPSLPTLSPVAQGCGVGALFLSYLLI